MLEGLLDQTPLRQRHLAVRGLQQNLHDALRVRGRQGRQLEMGVAHLVHQSLQDSVLLGQGGHDHLEGRVFLALGWLAGGRVGGFFNIG